MNPVLQLIERQPREVRLPARVAGELLSVAPKRLEILPTHCFGVYRLTSQGLVGEIRLSRLTIQIRPKIPLTNVAFLMGFEFPPDRSAPSETPGFLDLVAIRLANLMRDRLEQGLVKRYVASTDRQPFIKGRLDVAAQLRDPSPLIHQFQCDFETFTVDHLFHQLPKAAMEWLLKSSLLSISSRRILEAHLPHFGEISSIDPTLLRVVSEPCPTGYEALIELSRWILDGHTRSPLFLLDLERLFEQFLARRLAASLSRSDLRVLTGQRIAIASETRVHPDLELFPDLVIQRSSKALSILDAKWKKLRDVPEADDVQQVIAYGAVQNVHQVRLIYPGKRLTTRIYHLPSTKMTLLLQTIRIVGEQSKCESDWDRFVRSLCPRNHK